MRLGRIAISGRWIWLAVLAAALCMAAAFAFVAIRAPHRIPFELFDGRAAAERYVLTALEQHIAENGRGGVVMLGDSIVQAAPVRTLCNMPVFNAGIGGSQIGDTAGVAPRVVAALEPELIVYAVGVNDAKLIDRRDRDEAAADLASLAATANAPFLMVGPYPVDHAGRVGRMFDRDFVTVVNAEMKALGASYSAPPAFADTSDGVHLTPAEYARWERRIADRLCPLAE